MIKKNLTFFGLLALFVASCSNDEMNEIPAIQQDAIVVTAGLNTNTRVTFSQGDNVTHAYWDATDQITLYAASQGGLDYQVNAIGEGGSTATFAPIGDALCNTDEAIYATYPATVIKEGLAILPATDVWTDEKPLPFAYATSQVKDGGVNLLFNHLFAYLKLTLNAETTTDEVTSLWMKTSSSEPLSIIEGTYDIANDKLNLIESSNSIYFKLQEPFIATDVNEKSFYIPILPQPAGETITLSILSEHEAGCDTLFTISKETPQSGFLAGRAYTYSPKAPFIVEGNTITLTTAGTLSQAISAEAKDTITSLKIIGPLNGDDIRFIREMAGLDVNGNETDGKLTDLDISEATIVEGGGAYYNDSYSGDFVTIMNQVGDYMFYSTILENILLPKNTTLINDRAFSNCSSLVSVSIPDSTTSIGSYAFSSCPSLSSITIPNSIDLIDYDAFWGNESIDVYISDLSSWCEIDFIGSGANPLIDAGKLYLNNVEVTELIIPIDIIEIKRYTFQGCSSLVSVVIPNSVTKIGEGAFSGCSSLVSINIPDGVNSIGRCAFDHCFKLTSVTIPNGVTSIGDYTFRFCRALTTITIPNSVNSIGSFAFYDCTSLTSVMISDGVTEIGQYAFSDCSSLTSVTIPNSVTLIDLGAFMNCSSLTNITIPDGVTIINDNAFQNCTTLTEIVLGNSLTKIGNLTFAGCSSLTNITVPEKVKTIDAGAFSGCSSLVSVVIPESVTSIGDDAFSSCTSLQNINIPNGITSIIRGTFRGCSSLAAITIPENVTSIGWSAFEGCSSLTSIVIPKNVSLVEGDAFFGCSSLAEVTSLSTTPPDINNSSAFRAIASPSTLYVPIGCATAYSQGSVWASLFDIIEEIEL